MKYSFLIAITNNCNLNCSGCAWMCSHINEENKWFISKEEFENNVKILKEKLPDLDAIDITGGETLIHPDFMDLMDILISFKEKTSHLVWTNGLLLDKISDEDLIKLYNNNIYFQIAIYPGILQHQENQKKRFKKLKLNIYSNGMRIFFNKPRYNLNGHMDIKEQFKTCEYFHEPYQFILYKDKIYCCPTEPHMIENLNLPDDPKCYININDLKGEEDLMKLVSEGHNICKYCRDKNMGNDIFPWSAGNFKNKNYNFKSLKDLYLYDYNEYFNLLNDINSIKSISGILTNANKYIQYMGRHRGNDFYAIRNYYKKIFGILDIIIPFSDKIDNKQINKIKKILKIRNHNINMYFISIKENNINIENQIYDLFRPGNINQNNIFFLKTENITLEEIVNKYTFSKYIYYLPLDNNQNNDYKIIKRRKING